MTRPTSRWDYTHNLANSFIVFYPACRINPQHYLSSLTTTNLGQDITVGIYNLQYASAIINTDGQFKLSKYLTDKYTYQGVYIVPARIKYYELEQDHPIRTYPVNYTTEKVTITTPYARECGQVA